ncbi:MAG: SIMPL domain-containing protein [Methanothrix sp.]|nr:SIMPL domain-containing protein [Methanothrix sp.]
MMLALPGGAESEENVPKLSVDGSGIVLAPPDLVTIELGVETRNVSSDVAAAENAGLMNETVKALLDAGVRKEEIQTSQYRLSIPTESSEVILIKALAGGNQTLEYVATSSVKVKMNVSEDVGKVLGAAIAAGSNRVRSVTYSLRDSEPQKDEALAKAVADARRKAEIMASSAGVELGRVLEIDEGYSYFWEAVAESVAYEGEGSTTGLSVPLQPTDVTIEAKVEIVYELVQPES